MSRAPAGPLHGRCALDAIAGYWRCAGDAEAAGPPDHPYYAGVAHARAGRWAEAEAALRAALARADLDGLQQAARQALAEVFRCRAETALADSDMAGGGQLLAQARSLDAENARVTALLDRLGYALPVTYVLGGRRADAERAWTEAVLQDPYDARALHSLAVLYLWWPHEHLAEGRFQEAGDCYVLAAQYWSVILWCPAFRERWPSERARTHGMAARPEYIESACVAAREDVLRAVLHTADEADPADARPLRLAYGAVLGELKAAELLAEAREHLGPRAPEGVRIGGPRALRDLGGLPGAAEIVSRAAAAGFDAEKVADLRCAYSGRAPEWGLVRARITDLAIEEIERTKQPSAEQRALLSHCYVEKVGIPADADELRSALPLWEKGLQNLEGEDDVRRRIERRATSAAKPYFDDCDNTDLDLMRELVGMLRRLLGPKSSSTFRNSFANCLLVLAGEEWTRGRKPSVKGILEETLRVSPDNVKGKRDLAVVVTEEAAEAFRDDHYDEAVRAIQRARELDPLNADYRRFHSIILSNWAVHKLNQAIEGARYAYNGRDLVRQASFAALLELQQALVVDGSNTHAQGQIAQLAQMMQAF